MGDCDVVVCEEVLVGRDVDAVAVAKRSDAWNQIGSPSIPTTRGDAADAVVTVVLGIEVVMNERVESIVAVIGLKYVRVVVP